VSLALLAWAALDPYTLAWALPALPWALALATLVLVIGRTQDARRETRDEIGEGLSPAASRLALLGLALVFVLALALRLYHLDALPYGLWRDEARHALVALRMLEDPDYRPIYEPRNGVHLPGLGLAPFALALEVWGIHVWSLRTVTALAGALTVLPLYALVRRLFGRADVALLAAAFLAVSSWHLSLSRFSFPTVFDPLLSLSGLWLLAVALAPGATPPGPLLRRSGAALLGGVCLGLAAQTYHTGRLAPLAAALLVLLLLAFQPQQWRRWLGVGALGALAALLTVSPLVGYALRHPESFNDRVGAVFLLHPDVLEARPPLAALDASLGRHLLMFNVRGDSNGRHHAPGAPLLDYTTGAGFVVGVLVLLRGWRDWRSLFVLGALALGLLPSLLAVEGPHAMRSIGALPYACLAAALGWLAIAGWLAQRIPAGPLRAAARRLPLLALALALALNAWLYFGRMPTNPRVWVSFYPIHTQVGAYLRDVATTHDTTDLHHIYVARKLTRNPVFDYLAHGLHVETFSGDDISRPMPPDALFVLSGYTYQEDVTHLRPYLGPDPEPVARGPALPGTDAPSFVVYQAR
jgi:4-amino-4-deoxy-L-arabinose transferase-like glycosyltransferase